MALYQLDNHVPQVHPEAYVVDNASVIGRVGLGAHVGVWFNAVIRGVFGDDQISLTETSTAGEVEGWDSLMHLNVVIALEKRFGIRLSTAEISHLKEEGQNIGSLLQLIAAKKGSAA